MRTGAHRLLRVAPSEGLHPQRILKRLQYSIDLNQE